MMRYLVYNVDKHQSTPYFTNQIMSEIADSEAGFTVIVDLELGRRLWCGEWERIEEYLRPDPHPMRDKR